MSYVKTQFTRFQLQAHHTFFFISLNVPFFSTPSALLNCYKGLDNEVDLNLTGASLQPGPNQTKTVSWERDAADRLAEGADRRGTSQRRLCALPQ